MSRILQQRVTVSPRPEQSACLARSLQYRFITWQIAMTTSSSVREECAPESHASESHSLDSSLAGGGTAGCVLANRLSQDDHTSVLLIERGGVQDSWLSRVPLLSSHFASDGSRTRIWKSTPQTHANGRVFELAGGKSLGGSSRINAMLYTRGIPAEYNSWSQDGRQGWSYDDMQPYFKKSEKDLGQEPGSGPDFHGITGGSAWIKNDHELRSLSLYFVGEWQNRSYKKSVWAHTDQ